MNSGGDRIEWNYIGTLTNGIGFDTGTFDARIDRGDVIKGVDEGMKGLCVGGRRRMIMHHSYGYGPEGKASLHKCSFIKSNRLMKITRLSKAENLRN